jgi:hypothetical protein
VIIAVVIAADTVQQRRRHRGAEVGMTLEHPAHPRVLTRGNHDAAPGHILVDHERCARAILLSLEQIAEARAVAGLDVEEMPVA